MQKLRVWWIPQIPGRPFYVSVGTVEEGVKLMDTLAAYDLFQYENNIKGDYANMGGLDVWVDDEGDWVGWYSEDEEYDDPREYLLSKTL